MVKKITEKVKALGPNTKFIKSKQLRWLNMTAYTDKIKEIAKRLLKEEGRHDHRVPKGIRAHDESNPVLSVQPEEVQ